MLLWVTDEGMPSVRCTGSSRSTIKLVITTWFVIKGPQLLYSSDNSQPAQGLQGYQVTHASLANQGRQGH
jgi:hypothetical protein